MIVDGSTASSEQIAIEFEILKDALKIISNTGAYQYSYSGTYAPIRAIHEDPSNPDNLLPVYSGTPVGKYSTYYVGSTQDVTARLERHNQGRSKYTKSKRPWQLIYQEEYPDRSSAVKREIEIKRKEKRSYID